MSVIPAPVARQPWAMLFPLFILIGFGGLVLYSAAGGSLEPYAGSHLIRFGVFLVMAIVLALFPPDLAKLAAYPIYVVLLILLVIVEAIGFVHARRDWLTEQLAKIPPKRDPVAERRLMYRGTQIALDWRADAPRRPDLDDDTLTIGGPQDTLTRRLQRWLEAEALRLFAADARDYCSAVGLDTASVRLTRARKRWGSCSSEGVLRLNWRLVQAPDAIRRSVVAHEVAHLVHFDHSPAFHALLGELYEGDIDQANRWLSRHGRELYVAFD